MKLALAHAAILGATLAGALAPAKADEVVTTTSIDVTSQPAAPPQTVYRPYPAPGPGYGSYGGEPGLSYSSATAIDEPPRGITYPPIDSYGLSGAPGPDYVLPPREVTTSVQPLVYNGYDSTPYPQNAGAPPAPYRNGYVVGYGVRRHTYAHAWHRYAAHAWRRHAWHGHASRRGYASTGYAVAGDRDDLPAPTRAVKRCVYNDYGRINCNTAIY